MAKQATKTEVYTTSDGREVQIARVDPMFIQRVINSVKMPKRPSYEIKTLSGRTETHLMDAESAKETPGGEDIWEQYSTELAQATNEQNSRLMNALFYMGTKCDVPDDGWESKWSFLGIDVPEKPDERRAFYLTSELPTEDTIGLMSAILRLTGVPEESLREAQDAFRNSVPDGE
jgi:hypothetical protein